MADILDMEKINRLPHPLTNRDGYFIETICVQTGLARIDVHGQIDLSTIYDIGVITDADGFDHDVDQFYID